VRDLSALTAGDFEPLIGDEFHLSSPGSGADVVVVRLVEVLRQREWPGHRQPFVLHFGGPSAPVMYQAVYRLSHSALGELECLIGPVVSSAPGITYEAIFS
jgi:hypothetical protein